MPSPTALGFTPRETDQDPDRVRVGRPLDASRDDALRLAALELIADIGYDRMTIEAVAARAGAGKATVYRRWASKAELVVDALNRDTIVGVIPDTGTLRGDLAALSSYLFAGKDQLFKTRLISGMVSAILADIELRQAFTKVVLPPVRAIAAIIDRAVNRGEIIAPPEPTMLAAALPSLVLHRLIFTGQGPDPAFVDAVIDHILLPALLAESKPIPEENDHSIERS